MIKYRAIIVDDELTAREILETHLSKIDAVEVVAICKNGQEAFSVLSEHKIDLIFLDINMPEVTGLMLARSILNKSKIIFTTAYREYAVDAFELDAFDYLMKPISLERLLKTISKLDASSNDEVHATPAYFSFFKCDRKMVKVDFDTIKFVESCGDYVKLHLENTVIITRETMKEILGKLPKYNFCRVHRSYIIAIAKIESYTNEEIVIDKKSIPISRTYKDALMQRLHAMR